MHRTIVFDAVGTLIHPARDVALIYQEAGLRHGLMLDIDELQKRFKLARPRHFPNVGEIDEPTSESDQKCRWKSLIADVFNGGPEIDELFEDLWVTFSRPECWRLYPDVMPAIKRLAESGHSISVASNFDSRLNSILAGFPDMAAVRVFTSAETGFAKPSVRFFERVQSLILAPVSQLVMVGDDPVCDFDGSRNSGWKQILIARGAESAGRTPVIDRLTALPEAISQLDR
jgi:putative hydrolase of the HAD superfamily